MLAWERVYWRVPSGNHLENQVSDCQGRRSNDAQFDLLFRIFDRIGAMANVAADSQGVVATDRSYDI